MYPVIADPPSDDGALHVTVNCVSPFALADTFVGTPATVAGVTALEADDEVLLPTLLVAVTVNE